MNRRSVLIATVVVCFFLAGAAAVIARDVLSGFKEFEAMGNSLSASSPSCSASVSTNGELRGNVIGTGTYTLCLNPAAMGAQPAPAGGSPAPAAPAAAAAAPAAPPPAPGGGTSATVGTLVFTDDDGDSTFTLDIAAVQFSSNNTVAGTYIVDPTRSTGTFSDLLGGSGTLELSTTGGANDTIALDGVLIRH